MPLPPKYRRSAEAAVTYSYTDIAEGTGIQIFYGGTSKVDTTDYYHLLGTVIYSNEIETDAIYDGSTFAKHIDLDFDVTFNLPKRIKGTAFVNIPFSLRRITAGTVSGYVIAKIRHWDGTTETEIASAQSETLTTTGTELKKFLVKITVPLTRFKKGETLRLTIEGWAKTTDNTGDDHITIAHDPKGRAGDYIAVGETVLEAHIPFLLNI